MKSLLNKIISELEAGAKPVFQNQIIGRYVQATIEVDGTAYDFKIPYLEIMQQMLHVGLASEILIDVRMVKLTAKGTNDWHHLHYAFDEMEPEKKKLFVAHALRAHIITGLTILEMDTDPEAFFLYLKDDYNLIEAQCLLWLIHQKPTINNYGPRWYMQQLMEHLDNSMHIFPITMSYHLQAIGNFITKHSTPFKHLYKSMSWEMPYVVTSTNEVLQ